MKKNKILPALLCALASFLCLGGTVSMASSKLEVQNELSSGRVDITLEEYEIRNGERVLSDRYYEILPGKTLSKIPVVTNTGTESYVRVRLEFKDTEIPLTDRIYGMSDDWILAEDGYYYDRHPLDTGESVEVFEEIQIPSDYPQTEEEKTFELEITAEAVQAAHMSPDFSADLPWGEIEILKAEENPDGTTDKEISDHELSVIYEGNIRKFTSSSEDFFENLPTLYPGDSYSDTLHISNTSSAGLNLYFTQKVEEDTGLLEKLHLRLSVNSEAVTRVIYDGVMNTDVLDTDYLLASIAAGKETDLVFTVSAPENLNNMYADRLEHVTWIFRAEEDTDDSGKPLITTGKTVLTGDAAQIGAWMILAGISLFAVLFLNRYRRKKAGL